MNWIDILSECANLADDISLHYYHKEYSVNQKSDDSPVTQVDLEIEQKVRELISQKLLDFELYGEEFGQCDQDAKKKFIIDPIDGTRNFVRNIPLFASLMAIEIDGIVVAGMVSAPLMKDRWWAQRDAGAFYNGNQIHVSNIDDISKSQFFHGSLFGVEAEKVPASFIKLLAQSDRQRGVGDFYQHMLVAMGAGEASFDFGVKPWDLAPIIPILEEAGGKATNLKGLIDIYDGNIVCSNKILHQNILRSL
jgi:histidinol-phosphatase